MKLTKHEHACLVLEKDDQRLVIDPGEYTTPLLGIDNVVAIVITHQHPDHWSQNQLNTIRERNPEVKIFGPAGVAGAASDFPVSIVEAGDEVTAEPFTLRFFGGQHAVIHESIPVIDNVGVLVNEILYYAGDSFTVPPVPIDTLAVPAGAPWLKIAEVMDYVAEVKPKRAFPTHEMVLSTIGKRLSNTRIGSVTEMMGGEYFPLEPGETLEL
ncbi:MULTISPECIES: MBL fold metallo-hydrolase [unclassified Diaminobutyricimonas]|uniref:MBL fold metallo-hydrolase n=1 Tax=unclassified Diaminobutyricimonas TaxID=2643261 RepID=UPI0012F498A2|nr:MULTISPECIES: MBL fold metallo-hydrolase [unclassified Diaminobutyricimonas]